MICVLGFDERILIIKEIINPLLKQLGTSPIINPNLKKLKAYERGDYLVLKSKTLLSIPKLIQTFNIDERMILCKDIIKLVISEDM